MKRVRWKKDKIFSLELRNGTFALLQMLDDQGRVAVFNLFRDKDEWGDLTLVESMVLFKTYIIGKSIFKHTNICIHQDVLAIVELEFPKIRIDTGEGSSLIILWEGTKDEREISILGKGENLIGIEIQRGHMTDYDFTPIDLENYDKYKEYEVLS